MPRLDRPSACPSCAEPLEESDRFCGMCGADLTAAAQRLEPGDQPTLAINTSGAEPAAPAPVPPPPPTAPPAMPPAPTMPDFPLPPPDPRTDPRTRDAAPSDGSPGGAAEPPLPPLRPFPPLPPDPPAVTGRRCVACVAGSIDKDGYCEFCGHAQPRERDHMEQELTGVAAVSDRGLRHHRNEDSFAVSSTLLPGGAPAVIAVVCDGVSSSDRPDEASAAAAAAACASILDALPRGTQPQQAMHDALLRAADAVNMLAAEVRDPTQNAPACTVVSSVIADGILTVGWIGDSRVYWVPEDRGAPAARLTEDDSWAAQMIAAGLMNEADAYADARAHAITGWLGADAHELEPHTASFKPDRPGVVVVCTDGLWNYAESAEEMASAVPYDARIRPLPSARHLVRHALGCGGHDNVTVAVVPFPAPAGRAGSA